MNVQLLAIFTLASCLATSGIGAYQKGWLPPEPEQLAVNMIVERLLQAGLVAPNEKATTENGAREGIRNLAKRVESLGEAGVIHHAPDVAHLGLPRAGQALVDAIARYFVCTATYEVLLVNNQLAKASREERFSAALAPATFTVASLYLTLRYKATGGTEDSLRAFMTSENMEKVMSRIQEEAALLTTTYGRCRAAHARLDP